MQLSEYIEDLKVGPLSGINFGSNEETGITGFNRTKLISYINAGIVTLHTRFLLGKHEQEIELIEGQSEYEITPPEGKRFLKLYSFKTNTGYALSYNSGFSKQAVYSNTPNTITLPKFDDDVTSVIVTYGTLPERLDPACKTEQQIDLPMSLISCLTYYVVGHIYAEKQDQISMAKSADNLNKYEMQCAILERHGASIESGNQNNRLIENDWV